MTSTGNPCHNVNMNSDDGYEPDGYEDDFGEYDLEPDLDYMTEFDSAMASAGMGTDEDYGYFGGGEDW